MSASHPVVVPLDGSRFAEEALPVASAIAERWHVPVRLVRVHTQRASEVRCADGLVVVDDQRDHEGRLREASYLADRARAVDGRAPIEATVLDGPVASAVVRDVCDSGAGLVVMTTHGRRGLQSLWRGSVAEGIVRWSPAPLLLLHPGDGRSLPTRFGRVLVPLDESELARSILGHVPRIAEPGAEIVLLTVLEPSAWHTRPSDQGSMEADEGEREAAAGSYLERMAVPLRALGFLVSTQSRVSRRCPQAILDAAHELKADLIALATHGRSAMIRAALRSVAHEIVTRSNVPVLLHCPRTKAPDQPAELREHSK